MDAKELLSILEKYEKLTREAAIYNVRRAMAKKELSQKEIIEWIADLCDTTPGSVYAWFGPNRTYKMPLPVLAKISVALDVPFSTFLENSVPKEKVELRQKPERSNSVKSVVLRQYELYPEKSIDELAEDLGIARQTVIRHLKQNGVQMKKTGRPRKQ